MVTNNKSLVCTTSSIRLVIHPMPGNNAMLENYFTDLTEKMKRCVQSFEHSKHQITN